MLSASVFLIVASAAAQTSRCDQPTPATARKAAPRLAARGPLRAPWRETRLGSSPRPACVSLACPDAIVLGVGF